MTTAARGFRFELKRIEFGGGISTNQVIFTVPTNANYFAFINSMYRRTNDNNSIGTVTFPTKTTYEFSSVSIKYSFSDSFFGQFRDYNMASNVTNEAASGTATYNDYQRIVMPSESFRWNGTDAGTNRTFYVNYTEVYFGGQANY